MTLAPGIHFNIPFEYYLTWLACSNSQLSDLRQSPAHCRYKIDHPDEPTTAQILGSAIDLCVLQRELFVDLKSTEDASPLAFEKSIFNYGYHRQAFFYLRGMNFVEGDLYQHFVIIAVEKSPPYAVCCYRITEDALDLARREVLPLMDLYEKCQRETQWPAYPETIVPIGLPPWAAKTVERIETERIVRSGF